MHCRMITTSSDLAFIKYKAFPNIAAFNPFTSLHLLLLGLISHYAQMCDMVRRSEEPKRVKRMTHVYLIASKAPCISCNLSTKLYKQVSTLSKASIRCNIRCETASYVVYFIWVNNSTIQLLSKVMIFSCCSQTTSDSLVRSELPNFKLQQMTDHTKYVKLWYIRNYFLEA